jgi:hypothetical protein
MCRSLVSNVISWLVVLAHDLLNCLFLVQRNRGRPRQNMTPQEQKRGEADQDRPTLAPIVWQKMREHLREVAQQIAQSVQQAIADGQSNDREIETRRS